MKVKIRRVALLSLGRMGCLLGLVAAFLPSVLCGVSSVGLAGLLQRWLESWENFSISAFNTELVNIDFVQLLELDGLLSALRTVTGASSLVLLAAILGFAVLTGVLLAFIIMLVGLAYNSLAAITGGVVVETDAVRPREQKSQ